MEEIKRMVANFLTTFRSGIQEAYSVIITKKKITSMDIDEALALAIATRNRFKRLAESAEERGDRDIVKFFRTIQQSLDVAINTTANECARDFGWVVHRIIKSYRNSFFRWSKLEKDLIEAFEDFTRNEKKSDSTR